MKSCSTSEKPSVCCWARFHGIPPWTVAMMDACWATRHFINMRHVCVILSPQTLFTARFWKHCNKLSDEFAVRTPTFMMKKRWVVVDISECCPQKGTNRSSVDDQSFTNMHISIFLTVSPFNCVPVETLGMVIVFGPMTVAVTVGLHLCFYVLKSMLLAINSFLHFGQTLFFACVWWHIATTESTMSRVMCKHQAGSSMKDMFLSVQTVFPYQWKHFTIYTIIYNACERKKNIFEFS